MNVLDRAKQQYKEKMSATPRKLNIAEWGENGKPLVVYVRPSMNLERTGEILELSNNGKSAIAMAMTIIYRLIDEDGKPIFTKADKIDLLKHTDPTVLSDILIDINQGDPDEDDIAKN
jgi:hypothetical protein